MALHKSVGIVVVAHKQAGIVVAVHKQVADHRLVGLVVHRSAGLFVRSLLKGEKSKLKNIMGIFTKFHLRTVVCSWLHIWIWNSSLERVLELTRGVIVHS